MANRARSTLPPTPPQRLKCGLLPKRLAACRLGWRWRLQPRLPPPPTGAVPLGSRVLAQGTGDWLRVPPSSRNNLPNCRAWGEIEALRDGALSSLLRPRPDGRPRPLAALDQAALSRLLRQVRGICAECLAYSSALCSAAPPALAVRCGVGSDALSARERVCDFRYQLRRCHRWRRRPPLRWLASRPVV